MLAVYNWPRDNDRFRRVERFIQHYFDRFERLKKPPFHAKWKEINLAAKVPGWNRYWVAEELLARTASSTTATAASTVDESFARAQAAQAAPGNKEEQERLFQRFMEWSKRQKKQ